MILFDEQMFFFDFYVVRFIKLLFYSSDVFSLKVFSLPWGYENILSC